MYNTPFLHQVPTFSPKGAQYCYGNYDKYYGYRNSGAFEKDMRLSLLKEEWFKGKDCLDIGSNTGQVCFCMSVCLSVCLSANTYVVYLSPAKCTGVFGESPGVNITSHL